MTRRRAFALSGLVVATAVFLVAVPAFRHFFDLGVYRGAVRWWLLDDGPLYDFRYQFTEYGFTYPPFAALLFSPLVATSWPVAIALGLLVNAAMVALLLRRLGWPEIRARRWHRPTALVVATCGIMLFEPVRDTFSYGQVNLVLLVLVLADERLLARGSRYAGIGIGLAAAVKLTPGIFLLYLVVAGKRRAAAVAAGTAAAATALAALIAPGASRVFWTDALWDTERVGKLAYVSNQSLRGVLARLDVPHASAWWLGLVAVVLAVWAVRARRAAAAGDHLTGFALTGIAGCLVSPVTWVHHLVWVLPALVLLSRRRPVVTAVSYVLLCSSVVWLWWDDAGTPGGTIGGNLYVWICLTLLVLLPLPDTATSPAGRPRLAGRSAAAASVPS